jgi:drug/metabolite transporter (DMT)-like permease
VATVLGIVLLHERLSLPIAAGTLALLGGLTLVSVPTAKTRSRPSGHPRRRRAGDADESSRGQVGGDVANDPGLADSVPFADRVKSHW